MGVLLIHGFGGDISEVAPLSDSLKARGYTVASAELRGHGGCRKELRASDWRGWVASAQEALEVLKQEADLIFIIGFSMGGLIAVNLAIDNPVMGIATLNSPIYCWHKRQIAKNTLEDLKQGSREHIRHYLASGVKFPWQTLLNFQRLLYHTKKRLKELQCPIFVAQGMVDDTVSPRSAAYIFRRVGSSEKRLRRYPHSGHLICYEPDSAQLFSDLREFIESAQR